MEFFLAFSADIGVGAKSPSTIGYNGHLSSKGRDTRANQCDEYQESIIRSWLSIRRCGVLSNRPTYAGNHRKFHTLPLKSRVGSKKLLCVGYLLFMRGNWGSTSYLGFLQRFSHLFVRTEDVTGGAELELLEVPPAWNCKPAGENSGGSCAEEEPLLVKAT